MTDACCQGEEPVLVGCWSNAKPNHSGRTPHGHSLHVTALPLPSQSSWSSVVREMVHALSPCQRRYITPQRYPGPPLFAIFDTLDSFLHGLSFYHPPFPLLHLGELSPSRTVEWTQ